MQHPDFCAAFLCGSPSIFCPSAEDPPSVKEQLLQALLLHCSSSSSSSSSGSNISGSSSRKGAPINLYEVCGVMYEFSCARRAPDVHDVVFRFLLRSIRNPQTANKQLRAFLCEHLR